METIEFLKACGAFMLLTVDGDRPAGRPFGAVAEIDGDLYLSTDAHKAVYRQIVGNGNVQIVALKSGTRDWIRIDGFASICGSLEKKAAMLKDCPNLLKYYSSAEDPSFCLICVKATRRELHTAAGVEYFPSVSA